MSLNIRDFSKRIIKLNPSLRPSATSATVVAKQDCWLLCTTWELSITLCHWDECLLHISLQEFSSDIRRIGDFDLEINAFPNAIVNADRAWRYEAIDKGQSASPDVERPHKSVWCRIRRSIWYCIVRRRMAQPGLGPSVSYSQALGYWWL
jgi:hypothetical protein